MPAFVIRDALAILWRQQQGTFRSENDLLERIEEILVANLSLLASCRKQGSLIAQVLQIGAREPRRRAGKLGQRDILRQRHVACVHLENRLAAAAIRKITDTYIELRYGTLSGDAQTRRLRRLVREFRA